MTEYSKAFEKIAKLDDLDDDDVIGLLAYAYYKKHKRELARSGLSADDLAKQHMYLTDIQIDQFRNSALHRLERYASQVVDKVRPSIEEKTRVERIDAAEREIINVVKSSSSPKMAIGVNLLAWLISLGISFLVLTTAGAFKFSIVAGG